FVEALEDVVLVLLDGLGLAEAGAVDAKDVEDQHALVARDGAARLAAHGGRRDAGLLAGVADRRDHVVGVLLHAVVHADAEVGLGAVVVDREAAADVEVAHGAAHLRELDVELARLAHRVLDGDDARDLAPHVEVEELGAVEHLAALELVDDVHDLGGGEAELGAITGGVGPLAHAALRELGAHAERRPDAELLRRLEHQAELLDALEHDDDLVVEARRDERRLHVREVLVAVADDESVFVVHRRERDEEPGLGARLEAVAVVAPELDDVLDDVALLVDLDGEDAPIGAAILVLLDGLPETLVDESDPVLEDVRESDEERQKI